MSLYLEHFNLRELPFRITPAIAFFYRGCVRGETLDALKYAIDNGEGIMTVIGEVGTGKSMLCRVLMTDLVEKVELVYIANPSLTHTDIVFHIAEELGLNVDAKRHRVTRELQKHLLDLHHHGRRILVCIDEAQAMPDDSLEQIRLLSNLETATEKVIQIIMFGQAELELKLRQRHMRQLRERITSAFYLRKLSRKEVGEYILHRLTSACDGTSDNIFSPSAVNAIFKVSQGISRRINILCDKAMLAAFADNATVITASHIRKAAHDARYRRMEEVAQGTTTTLHNSKTWWATAAALLAVTAIAYQAIQSDTTVTTTASVKSPVRQPTATTIPAVPAVPTPRTVRPAPTANPPSIPLHRIQIAKSNSNINAHSNQSQEIATATTTQPQQQVASTTVDNPRWSTFPPSSYLRLRLNGTQSMFNLDGKAEQYTARIITVPRGNAIETERYLRDIARFFTIRNVLVYPAVAEGKKVFVVTYGVFPSEFQAELFIHELPSFFRTNKPFVQALAVARFEAAGSW